MTAPAACPSFAGYRFSAEIINQAVWLNTCNSGHLAGELFDSVAGVRTVHVPYRGNGPAMADLLSGEVPMMWSSVPPVIDHFRTGRLRVLCVGSAGRLASMPDVPTAAKFGVLPGYEAYSWVGLLSPAGTPAPGWHG